MSPLSQGPVSVPAIKEEKAIILDYLEHGYPFEEGQNRIAIAQALGTEHLTLLELVPKKGVQLRPLQEVYIGEGKREEIHHIKGRISLERLTGTAKDQLHHVIEDLVKVKEKQFVEFFNRAQPLSMRMHQLELLPGFGKKHMWEVIEARKARPFENFDDLKARVKLIPDPAATIAKRIIAELEGSEKYKIFVG